MIADFVNFQEMKCEAMPRFLLFFILTFSLSFSLRSESLESADGRVIQVELTRKNATHVWFKMPGKSKESSYEIAKLSEASKKLVEAWTAPKSSKFEVDFSSGKRNQKNTYGDIDDRCYSLLPKIKVRNLDSKSASFSGKAHLFIFGSPLKHRGDICLLAKRVLTYLLLKRIRLIQLNARRRFTSAMTIAKILQDMECAIRDTFLSLWMRKEWSVIKSLCLRKPITGLSRSLQHFHFPKTTTLRSSMRIS